MSNPFSPRRRQESNISDPQGRAPGTEALPRHILARDLAGPAPFVIDTPGHYLLAEDVHWHAADPDAHAITVAADDVTLDLGGHTLRQANAPAPRRASFAGTHAPARAPTHGVVSGNVGIRAEGRRRLRIRNGSVVGVQGVGIVVKDCHDVGLEALTLRHCGGDGVVDTSFLNRNGGLFVMGTRDADDAVRLSTGIRIDGCDCSDNSSALDGVVTLGALVLFCADVAVDRCRFDRNANTSPLPSGVQFNVVGVDFVICADVHVSDCVANENTSGGEPAGFFAWGENYRFERCRADGNFTRTGNRACGFNISTATGLEMTACHADGNHNGNPAAAADAVKDFCAAGFRLGRDVRHGTLRDCHSNGNHGSGHQSPVAGFMLNSCSDLLLRDCGASANRHLSDRPGADAVAAGFLASTTLRDAGGAPVGGLRNRFVDCFVDGFADGVVDGTADGAADGSGGAQATGREATGGDAHEPRPGFLMRDQVDAELVGCRGGVRHVRAATA